MATDRTSHQRDQPARRQFSRRLSRWWLDRPVLIKGLTVLAIPIILFASVTIAGIALQSHERAERHDAITANALSRSTTNVRADAIDAETGIRGYVATGDSLFLEPYNAALGRAPADLKALTAAAAAEGLSARAAAIAAGFSAELDRLAAIKTSARGETLAVGAGPALVSAKRTMDQLRADLSTLAGERSDVAASKRASIDHLERVIQVVQISGLGLGILAGLAGVALFTSGVARRVRFAADNANRLGTGEALLPTVPCHDELGRLGDSLSQADKLLATRLQESAVARDQAVLANEVKNTFMSRTSHELRTPLNAILGFAQLLEMSDLTKDDRDSATRILGAGRHLLALINELIDTARVEAGDLRLSIEPVLLDQTIEDVANLIRPLADARAITVERSPGDLTLAAHADKQRLRQVLLNLGSNAVKYNHHGGMITIGVRVDATDEVLISVTDNGPGLTPEQIERIFLPFERLEAEQHGIEGTGIGLPLSLALTEAMRGTLEVASVPGDGTTFTVRLPRALDDVPLAVDTVDPGVLASRAIAIAPARIIVLSIEDNAANALVLDRLFRDWPGATLYAATTGQGGIDVALQYVPDVILLDLHLPDLPGEEVFARLQAEPTTAGIPIIVVSADATPGTIRRLLTRGVSAYLTKPVDLRELHELINYTVGTRLGAYPHLPAG
jgi:signal transduction histidine kinase/CheY-like chemotaxis protein